MPESDLVLRPRSATELIDAAFQLYRRSPTPFIVAMALLYVPWLGLELLLNLNPQASPDQVAAMAMRSFIIIGFASIVLYGLVGGVTAVLTRAAYLDEPVDVAAAFRRTFSRFPMLIAAAIIELPLLAIGFILFIIPGVYLALRFFAVAQLVVLDDANPIAALGRSGALSRGHKLHILGTLLLVALLVGVVSGGAAMFFALLPSKVLGTVLTTAVAIVVVPIGGITGTLLYFDTRIRNEGFDVEYLANVATDRPAATGPAA
jgi:hypothetical protein